MDRPDRSGLTLIEVVVSMAVFTTVSLVILNISSFTSRLSLRNVSGNRGLESSRMVIQRIAKDLESSPTPYVLINYASGTVTDVSGTSAGTNKLINTNKLDSSSGDYICADSGSNSLGAMGVRYRRLVGPSRITSDVASGATTVSGQFRSDPLEAPSVGDYLYLPLLDDQVFPVSSVTAGSTVSTSPPIRTYQVGISEAIPYAISVTTGTVSAYVMKKAAYLAVSGTLYHLPILPSNTVSLTGSTVFKVNGFLNKAAPADKPFSLLSTSAGNVPADAIRVVRVAIQSYDTTKGQRTEARDERLTVVRSVRQLTSLSDRIE